VNGQHGSALFKQNGAEMYVAGNVIDFTLASGSFQDNSHPVP
jgi:hypothetical protein